MATPKRLLAATEILLVLPAAVFLLSIAVRSTASIALGPARTAERIVQWYLALGTPIALWGLLMAAPLAALMVGSAALVRHWTQATAPQASLASLLADRSTLIVASATVTAAIVLVIVGLHVLAD